MALFAEIKIRFKADADEIDERFGEMEAALFEATDSIEATLRGSKPDLEKAGLTAYLVESGGDFEREI